MDNIRKISKIKFIVFGIYWFTFFTPIYSQTIFGTKIKVSISALSAGTFFVLFFLVMIVITIITKLLFEKYYKYIYLTTLGFMVMMSLILLFFKDGVSTVSFSWYIQLLLIVILVFAHFREDVTLKVFDKIVIKTKEYSISLFRFVKERIDAFKRNKAEKKKNKMIESQNEDAFLKDEE